MSKNETSIDVFMLIADQSLYLYFFSGGGEVTLFKC